MRVHAKYACCTDTQLPGKQGLATSVGSVFGKPGPRTRPWCYVYCLHRAQKPAESGRGKPCSLAYWLVRLVFTPYLLNAVRLRKSPFVKSSQCGTEPVGIAFWPPCCA